MTLPKNELRPVVLEQLNVDPSYQRSDKPHWKKIAKNFNPKAAGTLVVNERPDKTLFTIDGQQRTLAMLSLGIETWMAQVLNLATVEEEAALFVTLNGGDGTKKNVGDRDKFKAALVAKDEFALAASRACESAGLKLSLTGNVNWPHVASRQFCVGFVKVHGEELLSRAMKAIAASWPQDPNALSNLIIAGVCGVFGDCPDVDDARLIRRLQKVPVIKLIQQTRSVGLGNKSGRLKRLVMDEYNKRLSPAKHLQPSGYLRGSRGVEQQETTDGQE